MLAYCVATNCYNLQTTPGITMHELPRNRPAVRRKWIKFIQFKRAFLLRRITPIYVVSTSVSVILWTPWNTAWGLLWSWHDVLVLSKSCLTGSNWYGCILVGLLGKVSVSSSELELAILQRLPEWHSRQMVMWFGCHGDAFGTTENAFFHAFITLRSQFHLHHCSQLALMEIMSKITPKLGPVF